MKAPRFVARPVEIEAVQWTGNFSDLPPEWRATDFLRMQGSELICHTLRHITKVQIDDYIVRGPNREFYPVDPATFEYKYMTVAS